MTVLPGSGKNFDQFRVSDAECRGYASSQVGGTTPAQMAEDSGVRSAVLGTAIGALAGAVIGGSQGAAVGAGTGLLVGGVAGSQAGASSAWSLQKRYDAGYVQCMYAKGHKVPVSGNFSSTASHERRYYPPPSPGSGSRQGPPANYSPRYPPPGSGTTQGPPANDSPAYPLPPPGR